MRGLHALDELVLKGNCEQALRDAAATLDYLEAAGHMAEDGGSLFRGVHHARIEGSQKAITADAVYKIVRAYSKVSAPASTVARTTTAASSSSIPAGTRAPWAQGIHRRSPRSSPALPLAQCAASKSLRKSRRRTATVHPN